MKHCRWCQREVPDEVTRCPHSDCARSLDREDRWKGHIPAPPPPPSPGMASQPGEPATPPVVRGEIPPPPPPRPLESCVATVRSAEAPPIVGENGDGSPPLAESELQSRLERLTQLVRAGRRRSWLLANGAVASLLLGMACWATYYTTSVLSFAALDPTIEIRRDSADRERLTLVYRPVSSGRIGFRRADVDRETELLDRVLSESAGKPQTFEWRVTGVKPGDAVCVTFRQGLSLVSRTMSVPEGPPTPVRSQATLAGRVVNAINNQPVSGAEVRMVGTSLSTHTDANGEFRFDKTPSGTVPIEVSALGFTKELSEQQLHPDRENVLRAVLNPGMEAGQIRIVLTWDHEPSDLDAHLEGPLPKGERFHVYYHQQGDLKSKEFVRLDVDDQDGEGPETITVLGVLPGTYRYFVHDYTNRSSPQANRLARSDAEVRVYQGGQTYRFHVGHERAGNVWNVCHIEVTSNGAVVQKVDTFDATSAEALGLYAKRTLGNRLEWLPQYGGNAESEAAVELGLAWLARHQAEDGSWGNYCLGDGARSRCEAASRCDGHGGLCEMAHTGLALLAFQAGGHYYFNDKTYSPHVRQGLDWMVARQRPDGGLVGSAAGGGHSRLHRNSMYEHGIATFALGEACAVGGPEGPDHDRYLNALRKAIEFIHRMQHADGGWRYDDRLQEPSDTSVTGWQVLALKTAKEAGCALDPNRIKTVRQFFQRCATGENGRTGYTDRHVATEATTGVGMLAHQFLFGEPDAPLVHEAASYLADYAERTWPDREARKRRKDFYLWYNCTLAMFQAGGEPWKRWNNVIRDTIIRLQQTDGCKRGSWASDSRWGGEGGRIYTTALAVLTLEVYYRYANASEQNTLSGSTVTASGPAASMAQEAVELNARQELPVQTKPRRRETAP